VGTLSLRAKLVRGTALAVLVVVAVVGYVLWQNTIVGIHPL
jgi:hypothetical protein